MRVPFKSREASAPPRPRGPRSLWRGGLELLVTVGIAVGLAYSAEAYVVKPYRIPSGSMEPTLHEGERVLVDRIGMDFGAPHVGAIVVFHPPRGAEDGVCGSSAIDLQEGGSACTRTGTVDDSVNFIKRIVAGPGDQLYVKEGHVYRRARGSATFVREKDSYIKACGGATECNLPDPVTVPRGEWFMMGDNRGDSEDSRYWGFVRTSWIIGEAFASYWPPDRVALR